jgi:cyclopropane fatty-acyl-phospholipid synthase-like methyltransferase
MSSNRRRRSRRADTKRSIPSFGGDGYLGCGSGAAAEYLASRSNIEVVCVTNSSVQAEICRRKFARLGGRGQVIVIDFDSLDLPNEYFDGIYALESIGYTKDLDAWLA